MEGDRPLVFLGVRQSAKMEQSAAASMGVDPTQNAAAAACASASSLPSTSATPSNNAAEDDMVTDEPEDVTAGTPSSGGKHEVPNSYWISDAKTRFSSGDLWSLDSLLLSCVCRERQSNPFIPAGPSFSTPKKNFDATGSSLLESEDSDLEDILDKILDRSKTSFKKVVDYHSSVSASSRYVPFCPEKGKCVRANINWFSSSNSISVAMDARLEYCIDSNAEMLIRRLGMIGAYNLPLSVNAVFQVIYAVFALDARAISCECLLNAWLACFRRRGKVMHSLLRGKVLHLPLNSRSNRLATP